MLEQEGIDAAAHPADVLDRPALAAALAGVERVHGAVDVLAYNPTPLGAALRAPENTTVDDALLQLEYSLLGGIEAVQVVLPGMLARRDGALLFTGGYSALYPVPSHASAGARARRPAELRVRAQPEPRRPRRLRGHGHRGRAHPAERDGRRGSRRSPEQQAALAPLLIDPDDIAATYWDMVQRRDRVEEIVGNPSLVEATMV